MVFGSLAYSGCSWLNAEKKEEVAKPTTPIEVAREAPNDEQVARIYVEKGVQYMEAGQYGLAQKDLLKAVDLDGDNSDARNALGVLYQRLENKIEAEANFRKAISLNNENDAARNNYGRFLCSIGRSAEAFEQFRIIVDGKLYAQPWVPLTNAGLCAISTGKKTEAERYYREALQMQPGFPPALIEMVKINMSNGHPAEARGYLQRYEKASETTADSLALGAEIELVLGNRQGAIEKYQSLRSQYPDSTQVMQVRQKLGM